VVGASNAAAGVGANASASKLQTPSARKSATARGDHITHSSEGKIPRKKDSRFVVYLR
jgi:hypothetical protein